MPDVYNYDLTTGYIIPDTAEIQAEVQGEYTNTFGADLDVTSPSTPQGLLINAETQARIAVVDNNAALANQINPAFAGGVFLDAILGLMASQRIGASSSQVFCTLIGASGTLIAAGSLVQDTNGNQWQNIVNVTIPVGGTISNVVFQAVESGAVNVLTAQISTIISNILGWDSVTNPAANYSTGNTTQSDASARQYRINTLFLQSNGLAGSVISVLSALTGVQSLSFLENIGTATTINGVDMVANSIYVCINGGSDSDIAAALTATKSAGCAYSNGASQTPVLVPYPVPISGQVIDVLFDRPYIVQIGVQLTVILITPIQDYVNTLTAAILNYAAGEVDGLQGLVVGKNVSPFEIAASLGIQYPGAYITNLLISNLTVTVINGDTTNGDNTISGLTNVLIDLDVGMSVSGTGIQVGTTILTIVNDTTITISLNATATGTVPLTFTGNYRAQEVDIETWELAQIQSSNVIVSLA